MNTSPYARGEVLKSIIFTMHKQRNPVPPVNIDLSVSAHELRLWQEHALYRFKHDHVFYHEVMYVLNEVTRWFMEDQPLSTRKVEELKP